MGAALRHDSAMRHATGQARFLDDVAEPVGMLHAALAVSPVAHGRITALNTQAAAAMPGVVAVIGPDDIPGENDIAPIGSGEAMLAQGIVEFAAQPLAIVVARTRDEALAAAAAVTADITPLPAILSIEQALENPRSEERRVGKECVQPCRSRWSPYH